MKQFFKIILGFAVFFSNIMLSHAEEKQVLTIYTHNSFTAQLGPGPQISKVFEEECACTIKWIALGDGGALYNRLKLEGDQTRADLVLGLDANLAEEARNLGIFGAHNLDKNLAKLPMAWNDDVFMPFDYGYFAVIYDSEKFPKPPQSLAELVAGKGGGKILLQDPRSSTTGLGFLLWMKSVYGEQSAKAWEELSKHVLTTTAGWTESYGLFIKGQAPMVLSYTTSPAYHMIEEKTDRYRAIKFPEGHYMQIEVAGLIDRSPRRALAAKFLQFMMSPAFQDAIPTHNWMLPAGSTSQTLGEVFGKLVIPDKILLLKPQEVIKSRRAWIDEWLNAASH